MAVILQPEATKVCVTPGSCRGSRRVSMGNGHRITALMHCERWKLFDIAQIPSKKLVRSKSNIPAILGGRSVPGAGEVRMDSIPWSTRVGRSKMDSPSEDGG